MRVFWKTLRDNRRGWIGWTIAVTAIAAMYSSFFPTIGKNPDMSRALEAYPESLKEAEAFVVANQDQFLVSNPRCG